MISTVVRVNHLVTVKTLGSLKFALDLSSLFLNPSLASPLSNSLPLALCSTSLHGVGLFISHAN